MFHIVNAFEITQKEFDRAAEGLLFNPGMREVLCLPMRKHSLCVPVQMDDASIRIFQNYREYIDEFTYFWSQYYSPSEGSWPVIFAKYQGVKDFQTQEPVFNIWVSRKFEMSNYPLHIRPP